MAERRPPGFNIPLGFYDGPEVKSLPRRIRAAAVGVWALCGTFSANKLQDGYVGPEDLKQLGCTDAIRAALKATLGPDGEPDPLWIDARGGGIQFTKWAKYQRSRAEVKAYLSAEAARKRNARNAKRGAATSDDGGMSGRTSGGQPPEYRDPKTETKTEIVSSHLSGNLTSPAAAPLPEPLDAIAATSGAELVRRIIPSEHPAAVQTALRHRASELVNTGTPPNTVEAALRLWLTKPNLGPHALPSLVSEVIKSQQPRAAPGINGLTAGEAKVAEWAALGNRNPHPQEAIER